MNIPKELYVSQCLNATPVTKECAEYLYTVYSSCVQLGQLDGKEAVIDLLNKWIDKIVAETENGAFAIVTGGFVIGSLENEAIAPQDGEELMKVLQLKVMQKMFPSR